MGTNAKKQIGGRFLKVQAQLTLIICLVISLFLASAVYAKTVRDEFNAIAYNGSDGTVDWSAKPWVEVGEDNGPATGDVVVVNGELRLNGPVIGGGPGLVREADLSPAIEATLTFDFRTSSGVEAFEDVAAVEISDNGGSIWTILETFDSFAGVNSGSRSYDIAAYTSANTQIRFRIYDSYGGPDEYFYVDNVQIEYTDISVDCDFSDWTDGDGTEFVIDDQGGPDDWTNPEKYDITRFGVASNLSDSFYLLFGFDDILPGKTTAAILIDTDLDDNVDFAIAVTLQDAGSTVELFTCDNSVASGCGGQTLSKIYITPQDYCVGTATGPWNTDTFVELALPYADLGSFTGGSIIIPTLNSYQKDDLKKPKDSIFEDYYDRILYDTDNGTGQIIDEAGTPTISGTVFSDEGITSVGVGKTVRLLVNGAVAATDTTDDDGYYFMVVPAGAGDNLLAYIDNDATYQGTTVTVFDGVQLANLDIYAGHVITRHDNGGTLSTANMATAKGGYSDTDILYSVSGSTLTVSGSGTELYMPGGHSFTPGGDITTPNMENLGAFNGGSGTMDINGTLTLSGGSFTATSGTMSIAGDFAHPSGTFAHNSGTIILDGTGQIISGSTSFNNLTKTVTTADTLTFEAGSTQTIVGTVTLAGAEGNLLSLRSSSAGTRWNFTVNAGTTKTISYVDVQDSNASGSDATQKPINPTNSVNSGNTVDWFPLLPDIIFLKSVQTFSDPFNGESNPKAIPGGVMLYTITATNQGDGATDTDTVFITDPIPANTALFVGDIDGPGPAAGPVLFTDGTPPNDSGLSYTFTSLDSLTDDLAFSNDDGSTYTYVPVPDAEGFDTNVTHMRITPKGTFNASSGEDIPIFEVKFKVRVE